MRGQVIIAVLAAAVAGGVWMLQGQDPAVASGAEGLDIAEGEALYAEACAACHGAQLEGQPDWRTRGPDGRLPAPPRMMKRGTPGIIRTACCSTIPS